MLAVDATPTKGPCGSSVDAQAAGRVVLRAASRRLPNKGTAIIAHAAISALAAEGKMNAKDVARALKEYKIDSEKANPVGA